MQQHNGLCLPCKIENAGNIAGKLDAQFPYLALDMLHIRLFQAISKFLQQINFPECFGLVFRREGLQKFRYHFFSVSCCV